MKNRTCPTIHCDHPDYHSEHMTRMMEDLKRQARYNLDKEGAKKAFDTAEAYLIKSEEHLEQCTEKE